MERLKTAIELQRALPGPLPLLDLRLYHNGAPIADFALPPEQDRAARSTSAPICCQPTLGAEGYINQSAYPIFAAPALAPTGALSLTLRLTLAGAAIEERQLASFERARRWADRALGAEQRRADLPAPRSRDSATCARSIWISAARCG